MRQDLGEKNWVDELIINLVFIISRLYAIIENATSKSFKTYSKHRSCRVLERTS